MKDISSILEETSANYSKKYVEEVPTWGIHPDILDYVKHTAGVLRAPTNLIVGEVMTIVGALIGKKVTIIDGDYKNRCNLFSAIVSVASGGKSPTMNRVLRPVNKLEAKRYEAHLAACKKAKNAEEEKPTYDNQLVVSNETIENLYKVLYNTRNHMSGLLMHQDELLIFFGANAKKYSDGNIIQDFLTLFDSFSALRVGRVRLDYPLFVEDPFIGILGGIQKKRIDELFVGQQDSGFFGRWQFWLQNEDSSLIDDADSSTSEKWAELVDLATSSELNNLTLHFKDRKKLIEYDDQYRLWRDWLEDHGEDTLAETIMKQGYVIRRLAGIVHCMNALASGNRPADTIEDSTLSYAGEVVKWLFANSCILLRVIDEKHTRRIPTADAVRSLAAGCNLQGKEFNQSKMAEAIGVSQQYISKVLKINKN
jgi:hypothetical protein